VKAPVTLNGCGAFVVYGASMRVPKSPRFHPSNPGKTETVSVCKIGPGALAPGWYGAKAAGETVSYIANETARSDLGDPVDGFPLIKALRGAWYYPKDRLGKVSRLFRLLS
jgi:hypothetical protein